MAEKENVAWVNFAAGGLASCSAKTLMNPLQRVTVKYQFGHRGSIADIVRELVDEERAHAFRQERGLAKSVKVAAEDLPPRKFSDVRSFWRGNLASMIQRFPYSGVQLMTYDRTKHFVGKLMGDPADTTSAPTKMISSAFAAVVSGTATYPIELVRTRQMTGDAQCRTIGSAVRHVWSTGGATGFYAGLAPSLAQRVPDIVINLTVYESVKYELKRKGYSAQVQTCAGGAAAALVAIAVSFPLDTIKKRMAAGESAGFKYTSTLHCASEILKEGGIKAFYRGSSIEAVRCVPQVILMWQLIELFRTQLGGVDEWLFADGRRAARAQAQPAAAL